MRNYTWVCHVCGTANAKEATQCGKCLSPMTMSLAEIEARKHPENHLPKQRQPEQGAWCDGGNQPQEKPRIPTNEESDKQAVRLLFLGFAIAPASLMARQYLFSTYVSLDVFFGVFFSLMAFLTMLFVGLCHTFHSRIHRLMIPAAGVSHGYYFLYDQATAQDVRNYLRRERASLAGMVVGASIFSMFFSKIAVYA